MNITSEREWLKLFSIFDKDCTQKVDDKQREMLEEMRDMGLLTLDVDDSGGDAELTDPGVLLCYFVSVARSHYLRTGMLAGAVIGATLISIVRTLLG